MTSPTADRVAIVTGSATGIGRAVAVALARARFRVGVNYSRSEEEAQQTAAQIEEVGSDCVVVPADVSNDADCVRFVRAIHDSWGRIDVLVNNAGFTRAVPIADLEQVTDEDWDRTFAVNVKGAFFMARACASSLRDTRGCIVNVSSTAGTNSIGSSIPYCASKAALNNLTLSLARALAPEVRVNAVLPGYVETRWNERSYGTRLGAMRKVIQRQTLLADVARPEHIAQIVCSIVSGMDWVTGELIVADGGLCVGT
jgi:3-oxoacyl-[acyl-carrier protein] reductase